MRQVLWLPVLYVVCKDFHMALAESDELVFVVWFLLNRATIRGVWRLWLWLLALSATLLNLCTLSACALGCCPR